MCKWTRYGQNKENKVKRSTKQKNETKFHRIVWFQEMAKQSTSTARQKARARRSNARHKCFLPLLTSRRIAKLEHKVQ